MVEFEQKVVKAINPGIDDYRKAGAHAGRAAADRFLLYCMTGRRDVRHTAKAALKYHAAAIDASCDRMRGVGATEPNLTAWSDAYVVALKAGLEMMIA